MVWQPEIEERARREELAQRMGGEANVARQHAGGKLTVRERIERLLDPGSFREIGMLAGAGHQNHSRHNLRVAWPSGDWGSLPVEGGLEAAWKRDLDNAADPEALKAELLEKLEAVRSPFRTAKAFGVQDLIDPRDTRALLCDWVEQAYEVETTRLGPKLRGMRV